MARQPRLVVPGIAMPIVQRGVDHQDCFSEETDRVVYLSLLRELCADESCAMHAYCLMTNHVHLLLTPSTEQGPSALMRKVGQRYVPYFNRRYGRTGTPWEGRFTSCVVESTRYVLACHRYIECNPVRAGMVAHARAYRWSSYAGNAGLAHDPLLAPHVDYLALGLDAGAACIAYRGLLDHALESSLIKAMREATQGGYPLVGEALETRLAKQARHTLAPGKPGPPRKRTDLDASGSLPFDGDPVLTPN